MKTIISVSVVFAYLFFPSIEPIHAAEFEDINTNTQEVIPTAPPTSEPNPTEEPRPTKVIPTWRPFDSCDENGCRYKNTFITPNIKCGSCATSRTIIIDKKPLSNLSLTPSQSVQALTIQNQTTPPKISPSMILSPTPIPKNTITPKSSHKKAPVKVLKESFILTTLKWFFKLFN